MFLVCAIIVDELNIPVSKSCKFSFEGFQAGNYDADATTVFYFSNIIVLTKSSVFTENRAPRLLFSLLGFS